MDRDPVEELGIGDRIEIEPGVVVERRCFLATIASALAAVALPGTALAQAESDSLPVALGHNDFTIDQGFHQGVGQGAGEKDLMFGALLVTHKVAFLQWNNDKSLARLRRHDDPFRSALLAFKSSDLTGDQAVPSAPSILQGGRQEK